MLLNLLGWVVAAVGSAAILSQLFCGS